MTSRLEHSNSKRKFKFGSNNINNINISNNSNNNNNNNNNGDDDTNENNSNIPTLNENDYTKRYVLLLNNEEKLQKQIDDLKGRNIYLEAENEKLQCVRIYLIMIMI